MSIFRSLCCAISLASLSVDECDGVPELRYWFAGDSKPESVKKTCALGALLTSDLILQHIPLLKVWKKRFVNLSFRQEMARLLKEEEEENNIIDADEDGEDAQSDDGFLHNEHDGVCMDRYKFFYSLVHHLPIPIEFKGETPADWKLPKLETITYEEFRELTHIK